MKTAVNIARIIVGVLFIFSGLVKAIDPLGLAYKMQEFFEVWAADGYFPSLMNLLIAQALWFSIIMITLEILLGLALLIGWRKHFVLALLLLLIIFFTFLTSYVLFTGKIRACGCFGDCIPLTPIQTFTKDIILLLLIIFLTFNKRHIHRLFRGIAGTAIMLIALAVFTFLQLYVLKHLPLKDCLPYRKGNNILELRKMPEDAVPDEYTYTFVYEKEGSKKEFTADKLPDSSWKFADRKQVLVKKGFNNIPQINDFSLSDSAGVNVTEELLGEKKDYYLFFIKDLDESASKWTTNFIALWEKAKKQNMPIYIVTADRDRVNTFFNVLNKYDVAVYTCDATAIKTAARANPTLFVMQGPVVQAKYSWADLDKLIK